MIYFLTTRRELPLVTAIEQVTEKRGRILTNIGFRKQLVRYCCNNGLKLKRESGEVRGKRKADRVFKSGDTVFGRVDPISQPSPSIRSEPETETRVSVPNQKVEPLTLRLGKDIRSEMHHTLHAPIGVVKLLLSGSSGSYGVLFATRANSLLSRHHDGLKDQPQAHSISTTSSPTPLIPSPAPPPSSPHPQHYSDQLAL